MGTALGLLDREAEEPFPKKGKLFRMENPPTVHPLLQMRKGKRKIMTNASQAVELEREGWERTGLGQPGIELPAGTELEDAAPAEAEQSEQSTEDEEPRHPRRSRRHEG